MFLLLCVCVHACVFVGGIERDVHPGPGAASEAVCGGAGGGCRGELLRAVCSGAAAVR